MSDFQFLSSVCSASLLHIFIYLYTYAYLYLYSYIYIYVYHYLYSAFHHFFGYFYPIIRSSTTSCCSQIRSNCSSTSEI